MLGHDSTHFSYPGACYMLCTFHPPFCGHLNILWGIETLKLIIMHFSASFCYLVSAQIFCSVFSVCVLPFRWDQVSHPYKTALKTVVLSVLLFSLLCRRWGILYYMVASVPGICYAPNFFMNVILFRCSYSQVFELCYIFKWYVSCLYTMVLSCILIRDEHKLSLLCVCF